jgi:uncharacterized membrane protein
MKWFALVLVACLLVLPVRAAMIEGDVYEFDLTPAKDVVVEINTTPQQQIVALNGSYSVSVPAGTYTLTATDHSHGVDSARVSENITVQSEGVYTLDLILFPLFRTSADLENDVNMIDAANAIDTQQTHSSTWLYVGIGAAIIIALIALFIMLRRKRAMEPEKKESDELDDLVSVIKKLGGRTTQKELRKEFPYSEAKVSLMLTELEHKGVVTKIRRGRANVIILK